MFLFRERSPKYQRFNPYTIPIKRLNWEIYEQTSRLMRGKSEDITEIKKILKEHPDLIHYEDSEKRSAYCNPLETAIFGTVPPKTLDFLLKSGADPGWELTAGTSVLLFCALNNESEAAEILIQNGADIEWRLLIPINRFITDLTPLYQAAWSGSVETAEVLLKHGAKLKANPRDHSFVIHWASQCRKPEKKIRMIKLLLQYGADINEQSNVGKYPIHYIHTPKVLNFLLAETDIDIHKLRARDHTTLLHTMVYNAAASIRSDDENKIIQSRLEMIRILIKHGANPHFKPLKGKSAIELAEDHEAILAILAKAKNPPIGKKNLD